MEQCLSDAYLQAPSAPSVRTSWQRCRGAVLPNMLRSRLQRGLRDVAWAIHAPNEHIVRRQCQDALADIPAMHARQPDGPSRAGVPLPPRPWYQKTTGRGVSILARGTGRTRSAPLRLPVSPMSPSLVTRLPEWAAGQMGRKRLWFLLRCSVNRRFSDIRHSPGTHGPRRKQHNCLGFPTNCYAVDNCNRLTYPSVSERARGCFIWSRCSARPSTTRQHV